MTLVFGPFKIDTKGLPAVSRIHVNPPVGPDRPVIVYIALVSETRTAVGKWAKRLGAAVTEELCPLFEDDPKPLDISTQVEADGVRVHVWIRTAELAETDGVRRDAVDS